MWTHIAPFVTWPGVKKNWDSRVCAVQVSTPMRLRFDRVLFEPGLDHEGSHNPRPLLEHRAFDRRKINNNWITRKGGKRIKANSQTTANFSGSYPELSPSIHNVQFKLLSCNQSIVRVSPMAGCIVYTLFQKAREFYQNAEADGGMVLHLKMPGIAQERYIRESYKEEFDILCEDVKNQVLVNGNDGIIEVTLQKSMEIEEVEIEEVKTKEEGIY